ncbi:PQQ-binding-like beta-propeller repeat protein [Natrialbaceae archaeon A-CW1-1]
MEWNFPYYDAGNTSYNPTAMIEHQPVQQWCVDVPSLKSPPIVRDGMLILTNTSSPTHDGASLAGYSCSTGELVWHHTYGELSTPVTIDESLAFIADGGLQMIEPTSGTVLGRQTLENGAKNVTTDDEYLFISGETVQCFDLDTGEEVWTLNRTLHDETSFRELMAVGNEALYIGHGESVTAVEKTTGERLWCQDSGGMITTPTVDENQAYITGFGGTIYTVDAITGEVKWTFDTRTWIEGSVAVDEDHVYFGGTNNYIVALTRESGEVVWASELDSDADTSPVVTSKTVVISTLEGWVYGIDRKTGEEQWRFKAEREPYSPAVVDNDVYVINSRAVYRLHCTSEGQ